MKSIHTFILTAKANGEIRTAQFNGTDHIVVPVVMMCEGVVWAVNSPFPALVLAEEFSRNPLGWNGRPVVGGHPYKHGEPVSANDPQVLADNAFGVIFNTQAKGDRLCAEAWIDPVRASRPGSIGERTLERIREGKDILEVSVGVFTDVEMKSGLHNGQKYEGIWRDYVPDHLAILAEGDIGACSVEMGCGAMRAAATHHLVTASGMIAMKQTTSEVEIVKDKKQGIFERFGAFLKSATAPVTIPNSILIAEDASDREVANLLDAALRASEPGYMWLDEVFSSDGKVVFAVAPADRIVLVRRSFSIDGATVALGDDREEVVRRSTFEAASADPGTLETIKPKTAGCGCGGNKETKAVETAGENDMTKVERIAKLVASKKLGPAMTVKVLEGLTDEQITAIEAAAETAVVETPATPVVDTPVVAAVKPAVTVDDYINQAPEAMRGVLRENMRVATQRKNGLIARLRASKKCSEADYPDAELQAMEIPQLERLGKLAGIELVSVIDQPIDFSLNGASKTGTDDASAIPEPPSLVAAIQNKGKK
jgi:hypothetical protein